MSNLLINRNVILVTWENNAMFSKINGNNFVRKDGNKQVLFINKWE